LTFILDMLPKDGPQAVGFVIASVAWLAIGFLTGQMWHLPTQVDRNRMANEITQSELDEHVIQFRLAVENLNTTALQLERLLGRMEEQQRDR